MCNPMGEQDKFRMFVAVRVPILPRLQRFVEIAKSMNALGNVNWVDYSNWHVTLQFIGAVTIETLEIIDFALSQVLKDKQRFDVHLGRLGFFPHSKTPRILWPGLLTSPLLLDLQQSVSVRLQSEGVVAVVDDVFTPHLTLARSKAPFFTDTYLQFHKSNDQKWWGRTGVDEVVLMKSTHLGAGPVYSPLKIYPLS